MNYSNPLGFEMRDVRDATHEGQPARTVCGSRVYTTDVEDLWDAVTNPERIPRWFLPVSGEFRPGGRYQLEGNAGGTITHCAPPRQLDLTWEIGGTKSWLNVTLEAHEHGTRLTLAHTMPKDEASEKHWSQYGAGATGVGWDLGLFGLQLHIESGEQVDSEAFMAWATGDAGRAFARRSAEQWGEAHTASGVDAEVARAMAARTAAFFTGE